MARSSLYVLTVALTAALLPAGGAAAAGRTWDGGGDGIDWYDPANWAPDGGPDVWDELSVLEASTSTGEDVTADEGGMILLDGDEAAASFRRLFVGDIGEAALHVYGGAELHTGSSYVGNQAGSDAAAVVRGEDSTWDYDGGGLYVGSRGRGGLDILDGATVRGSVGAIASKPGSYGVVTVAGTNTKWTMRDNLFVGHRDEGFLRIEDGASVEVTDYGSIGHVHDGVGYVTVVGPGSSFVNGRNLRVGFDGEGWLSIADGATASSPDLFVGAFDGSEGHVSISLPGSAWIGTGEVTVGEEGTGVLDLFEGGTVRSGFGYVGKERGGVGEVHIFGSGSEWSTDRLTVGQLGTGRLDVAMGGRVVTTGTSTVYVGKSAGSDGAVDVHGPGATCTIGGDLRVGYIGTGEISAALGGRIETARATLGVAPGSVGRAAVAGADSSWQLGGRMIVGDRGEGALDIIDGATVIGQVCSVGFRDGAVGKATLDGAGSSWTTWLLNVGGGRYDDGAWIEGGAGAGELVVSDGAELRPLWTYVGGSSGAVGHVTVRNATWDNQESVYVGVGGTGIVDVVDGSTVAATSLGVGWLPGGNGTVTVAGAGSNWTGGGLSLGIRGGDGTVKVLDGGRLGCTTRVYVGADHGSTGRLVVDGGTMAFCPYIHVGLEGVGEMDVAGGGVVDSRRGFIGDERCATGVATVRGEGSRWSMVEWLYVGESYWEEWRDHPANTSGSGTLVVADGGEVSNETAHVGPQPTGTGSVRVCGAGSEWITRQDAFIGDQGDGTLEIRCGGQASAGRSYVGHTAGSAGRVVVDGPGSTWTAGHCLIGDRGEGALEILDGAAVIGQDCSIGFRDGAVGRATLDGAGSSWTAWVLNVGGGRYHDGGWIYGGAGTGELVVSNGAELRPLRTYVGRNNGAVGHVTVCDATWDNQEGIYVGVSGTGTVDISHGSTVTSKGGYIGWFEGGDGTVTVAGAGSSWTHGGLYIGLRGGEGAMEVRHGGTSYGTASAYVGDDHGSTGRLTVHSATFVQEQEVHVGREGVGEMDVTGGGVVQCRGGHIGYERRATGVATVAGDGSRWSMSGELKVGESYWDDEMDYPDNTPGSGTLIIADGGEVSNGSASLAPKATGTGSVTVCGAGALWTTAGHLHVGLAGAGSVQVTGGGRVVSGNSYLGSYRDACGEVSVAGAGSRWDIGGSLYLAGAGAAAMEVLDGAAVNNGTAYMAFEYGGSDAQVTVAGGGALWEIGGDLFLAGYDYENGGSGRLEILPGGTVAVGGTLYLWTDGVVDLHGGTIRFDAGEPWPIEWHGGEFNFGSGMVAFDGDMTVVGGGTFVNELFGSPVTLPAGKGLGITGTATLDATVTLDGGTFALGQLAGIERLEFNAGTLSLTDTELTIGSGGLFGKTLSLNEGQHVSVTRPTTITNQGRLEVAGGSFSSGHLTNRGRIDVVEKPGDLHGHLLNDHGGKVVVSDGADAFFHDNVHNHGALFKVDRGCTATFYGHYWGKGIRGKGEVFFAGPTAPGFSAGIVTFEGNIAFAPGSELSIELGDNDNSDPLAAHYDSMVVDGNVALAGALALEWLPIAGEGDSTFGGDYDILTCAGELTGEFDEIAGGIGSAYLAGIDYAAEIGEGTRGVRVTLHDLIDGDVDLDGEVGYADYAAARDGFAVAAEPTWAGGDLDRDGDLDVDDYLALKLNFGRSVGGEAAPPAVPEPTTLALLAALALPLLTRRRGASSRVRNASTDIR